MAKTFYSNGAPRSLERYTKNRLHGLQNSWWPDGSKKSQALYANGQRNGIHYEWYNNDPEFKDKVDELKNVALDFAESQLHKQIQSNSTAATIFYLKTQGKKRGYIEKQEIDLTSGNEQINKIEIEIVKSKGNSSSTEKS